MPARTSLLAYVALGAAVLFFGLRWLSHDADAGGAPARAGPSAAPVIERAPRARTVVHVAGAVRRPGVYSFAAGARVRDALRRAGGARGGDPNAINLAAKLADGQQVIVPPRARPGGAAASGAGAAGSSDASADDGSAADVSRASGAPPASTGASPASTGAPVSLGSATLEQLDALDGVGPVMAQKILERRAQGGIATIDDLAQIPGIGPKRLESLRRQLVP